MLAQASHMVRVSYIMFYLIAQASHIVRAPMIESHYVRKVSWALNFGIKLDFNLERDATAQSLYR